MDKWNRSLVVEDPTFYTHWKAGTGQLAAGEPLLDGPPVKHSLKANPVERCPWSMMASEQCVVAVAVGMRCCSRASLTLLYFQVRGPDRPLRRQHLREEGGQRRAAVYCVCCCRREGCAQLEKGNAHSARRAHWTTLWQIKYSLPAVACSAVEFSILGLGSSELISKI